MNKIWGIGLSKTGTLSLHQALKALGLHSCHYPPADDMLDHRFACLDDLDAAMDIPVAHIFQELDHAFPSSRFIFTVRDETAWLASITHHLAVNPAARASDAARRMRTAMYGSAHPDQSALCRTYQEHSRKIRAYFADRPDDLLVLDICRGEGWEKLCPFLGMAIPESPFPHAHRRPQPAPPTERKPLATH